MGEKDLQEEFQTRPSRGYFSVLAAAVPIVTICVITISANGVILTMFLCRRGLRRCKNLSFISLALADFLVGLSMPYKLAKDLHYTWDTGSGCRVYQTLKQTLAYASFMSIFLITWDKWRAVHYPVSYRKKTTKYMTIAAVICVWTISVCIFTLPQIWWENLIMFRTYGGTLGSVSTENEVSVKPRDISTVARNGSDSKNSSFNSHHHKHGEKLVERFGICPEGYNLSLKLSAFAISVFYVLPLLVMAVFDLTLYFKIKWRKSVEVQRSTSVTDTYFMTLKKPTLELPDSCMPAGCGDDDSSKEFLLKNSETKLINKHLAIGSRGERRHSSLPSISPTIQGRTSSGRRVSMPESNSSSACRYVGRKWSGCAPGLSNNLAPPPNPMANLAPRVHNEDMVHDILVKQDKTTARCLCFMLLALVTCWLPHAVVSLLNARCWCYLEHFTTITSWFYHLDHAVNPFLYGLMYVQFKNVFKQWLLIERVHAFKMRDTLILKSLQKQIENEDSNKQRSPNPQSKQNQFDIPQMTSIFDMTQEDMDNTPL